MMHVVLHDRSQVIAYVGVHMPYDLPEQVVEIQADGDELDHILARMSGLPRHNDHRVQRWFGDDAKFIVANW